MNIITSHQNEKVKLARGLQRRKVRDAEGLFVIEGTFHLGEAAAAGAHIEFVLYSPEYLRGDYSGELISSLRDHGVDCLVVASDVMASVADKDNPQGLLAIAKQQYASLSSYIPSSTLSTSLLQPADPGNLGTILRTLDAVNGGALFLLDGGVDPYHPTAVRAGLGAHFWHPIIQASFDDFATWVGERGIQLLGSSAQGGKDYHTAEVRPPSVLLMGSEREGLSEAQRTVCDQVLTLPMSGRATSLNLAVAAGILLYSLTEKSGPEI